MDKTTQLYHDEFVGYFPLGRAGKTVQYPAGFCWFMNIIDKRVCQDCLCEWVEPYGFAIEGGCSEHD